MSGTNDTLKAVIALLVFLVAAPAFADGIEVTTQVHKRLLVPSEGGDLQERLVPPAKVVPGDIVAYTISARNGSAEPAERVVITDPVPEHMKYVEGSAVDGGARVLFSSTVGSASTSPRTSR